MSAYTLTQVYEFVVDGVINKSRKDFENMGFSESVLDALQKAWENKIGLARVTPPQSSMTATSSSSSLESSKSTTDPGTAHTPVQAPAETSLTQGDEPPASLALAPPSPVPVPVPVPRPPSPVSLSKIKENPVSVSTLLLALNTEVPDIKPTNVASNTEVSLPGQIAPEVPAPGPAPNRSTRRRSTSIPTRSTTVSMRRTPISTRSTSASTLRRSPRFRQTDGASADDTVSEIPSMLDDYADQVRMEEKEKEEAPERGALGELRFTLTLSKKAASKARRTGLGPLEGVTIGQVDGDETDELLGSDLDDTDEDDEDEMGDMILCQWDKVNRQKSGKWTCTMTYGIMSINNCDYLFKEAKGEFRWQEEPKWTS